MSWPMVKLGDVATVNPRAPKELGADQIVSFVGMASVSEDGFLYAEEPRILEETKKGFTYFAKSDVLLAKITPCFENGKCLRANQISNPVGFGSTEFHVLRPDESKLDSTYLFYMIWSNQFRTLGAASMFGAAGQKRVGSDFLKSFEIPLPPLAEQKRIAAILDKADAIRRKRQQAIQLADDFLRAVFLDMFGDPVTNPKGWELRKLGDLCDVGSSKRVFVEEFVESGIPFYRGTEVGKLGNGEEIVPSLFISEKHYQKLKEHGGVPHIGDLLLPSICPDGRIWQVSEEKPFYFKDGRVLWIKSSNASVSPDYLRSYLQHIFFTNYNAIASGTTFAELKIVALKNLVVLIPPKNVQEQYSSLMKKTLVNISNQLAGLNEQSQLFDCISQKAFSGQL